MADPIQTQTNDGEEYQWAYLIMDSGRVSGFLIPMLLIVYGSFRSLNMEQEARDGVSKIASCCFFNPASYLQGDKHTHTIEAIHALFVPLLCSISLLIMFFFFDSMQMLFAIGTAITATLALAFLLSPMCQYITRPCTDGNKISFGMCGRFTIADIVSLSLAIFIVCIWILTGHWLLMDAMAMGLCVAFIAFIRVPSLKVSTLLLTGLLIYDVFWVFFSSYVFSTNVMVKVATKTADNPVGVVARKLHLGGIVKEAPKLSLPGKLYFPSTHNSGYSMLGLGDIVMPGLLLCFVLRYDAYQKAQGLTASRLTYFHCSLLGYFLGLLTTTVTAEVFKAAQPALLYLVPFTLLPLLFMAYLKGDLRKMWSEPFKSLAAAKHIELL